MLFRLKPEDFKPEERRRPPNDPPSPPARMCDLSPEEWEVVHMMLSDHRRHGEVLAEGRGDAAALARRLATGRPGS